MAIAQADCAALAAAGCVLFAADRDLRSLRGKSVPSVFHELDILLVAMEVIVSNIAVLPLRTLPGVCEKVSQIDAPRPASCTVPSTW